MEKRLIVVIIFLLAIAGASAALPAQTPGGRLVFSVVMTRHGVRSFTKAPPEYTWPDWQPVAPGFLSEHGYKEATYLGAFYRRYFASHGLPMGCANGGTYVYADVDQRTLATAHALIEGACGSSQALPVYHDVTMSPGTNDPLFDGADWLGPAIDTSASRKAVEAGLPAPPSAVVSEHAADFAALQALLDERCGGTCAAVTSGASAVVVKKGLAGLAGPVDVASAYAESLFLQYAQCGPTIDSDRLAAAMRLHVLAYDINTRNAYNPLVKGGNVLAHIIGLLEAKAGAAHPGVTVPDVSHVNVAFISGHDTQVGSIGGIMNAHWELGDGLVRDDMPPGGALVFELYRAGDAYSVRIHFAYETLNQLRHDSPQPGGVELRPVTFPGCEREGCSVPLLQLATLARSLIAKGLVMRDWTNASDAPVALAPLRDPPWTKCLP